jgi:hypothetical protein
MRRGRNDASGCDDGSSRRNRLASRLCSASGAHRGAHSITFASAPLVIPSCSPTNSMPENYQTSKGLAGWCQLQALVGQEGTGLLQCGQARGTIRATDRGENAHLLSRERQEAHRQDLRLDRIVCSDRPSLKEDIGYRAADMQRSSLRFANVVAVQAREPFLVRENCSAPRSLDELCVCTIRFVWCRVFAGCPNNDGQERQCGCLKSHPPPNGLAVQLRPTALTANGGARRPPPERYHESIGASCWASAATACWAACARIQPEGRTRRIASEELMTSWTSKSTRSLHWAIHASRSARSAVSITW